MSGPTLRQIQTMQKMQPGTIGGASKAAQPITYAISKDESQGTQWTRRATMPTPRAGAGGAVLGGRFYTIGGATALSTFPNFDPVAYVDTVESYQGGSWRAEPSLPAAFAVPGCVTIGSNIYVVGGADAVGLIDTLYIFDGASWTTGATLPVGTSFGAVGVLSGQIHAVNTLFHWVYDPGTDTWTTGFALPGGSVAPYGVVVAGGVLYAIRTNGVLRAYNAAADTWTTKATSPLTTASITQLGVYDALSFIEIYSNTAARYSIGGNTWATFAPPPTPRVIMAMASAGGTVYTAGGALLPDGAVSGAFETYG